MNHFKIIRMPDIYIVIPNRKKGKKMKNHQLDLIEEIRNLYKNKAGGHFGEKLVKNMQIE